VNTENISEAYIFLKQEPTLEVNEAIRTFIFALSISLYLTLFESLCERDLRIYTESFNAKLYHYQDYDGVYVVPVTALKN